MSTGYWYRGLSRLAGVPVRGGSPASRGGICSRTRISVGQAYR